MRNTWLRHYDAAGFAAIDPFIDAGQYQDNLVVANCGSLKANDTASQLALDLNYGLAEYGYSQLQGHVIGDVKRGPCKLVSLCFQDDAHRSLDSKTARSLSRLIASAVGQPLPHGNSDRFDGVGPPKLSPREIDTLSLLANGHPNYEIAHKLCISETMVQRHLRNARVKLGAKTREEALIIAIKSQQVSI